MNKTLAGLIMLVAGIACGLILAYGPIHAESSVSEGDIMAKLDEISKNQEEIAVSIRAIKEDMQLIKVRITQMQ